MVRIDIGCGAKKREGHIGVDIIPAPGVDHIVNLLRDPLPFPDRSVDAVYSSHAFEHLREPNNLWREISRVAKRNADIEIWTPYAHSDEAFLPGHVQNWARMNWEHVALSERAFYSENFLAGGYWEWLEARYIVPELVYYQLKGMNIPLAFAIRHMVNIVTEWGCFFAYRVSDPGLSPPREVFSYSRSGPFSPIDERPA